MKKIIGFSIFLLAPLQLSAEVNWFDAAKWYLANHCDGTFTEYSADGPARVVNNVSITLLNSSHLSSTNSHVLVVSSRGDFNNGWTEREQVVELDDLALDTYGVHPDSKEYFQFSCKEGNCVRKYLSNETTKRSDRVKSYMNVFELACNDGVRENVTGFLQKLQNNTN